MSQSPCGSRISRASPLQPVALSKKRLKSRAGIDERARPLSLRIYLVNPTLQPPRSCGPLTVISLYDPSTRASIVINRRTIITPASLLHLYILHIGAVIIVPQLRGKSVNLFHDRDRMELSLRNTFSICKTHDVQQQDTENIPQSRQRLKPIDNATAEQKRAIKESR